MGFFGDMTDAVKKRMQDPPKFRDLHEKCTSCTGSGVCASCGGKPKQTGAIVAALVGIAGLGLSFSSCATDSWGIGFLSLIGTGFAVVVVNIFWHCSCTPSAFSQEGAGKCPYCQGKGYNIVQKRIGGTDIFQAISQTTEATRLTNEFGTSSSASLPEMERKIDRALELNPNHFAANAVKGILHFDRGDNKRALQYLEKAEARKPKNIEIKQALCAVHEEMGNLDVAERKYMEAVALGVKALNRKQMVRNVSAGAVGGIVGGLVGLFVPFLDE